MNRNISVLGFIRLRDLFSIIFRREKNLFGQKVKDKEIEKKIEVQVLIKWLV